MAEINFGLLDTQLPGRIATIPLQAQEAGQANALRAMQMMQGMSQNRLSDLNYNEQMRGIEEQKQIRSALSGIDVTTPQGQNEAVSRATRINPDTGFKLGKMFQDAEKSRADLLKTRAETDKIGFERASKNREQFAGELRQLALNPTDDNVQAVFSRGVSLGIPSQDIQADQARILALPLDQRARTLAAYGAHASDVMNTLKTTTRTTNLGNISRDQTVDFYGRPVGGPTDTPIGISANTAATLKQAQDHYNSLSEFQKQTLAQNGWSFDSDRGIAVNARQGISRPISTLMSPVSGGGVPAAPAGVAAPAVPGVAGGGVPGQRQAPAGQPAAVAGVLGPKPEKLNESQGNATAYGLRMKEANSILENLARPETGTGTLRGANVEAIPFVGGAAGKVLPSFLGGTSEQQQQVNQAKSNFITAVLRKESGAVINDSEFEREDNKYFPQLNDGPKVIKQKENARKLAIEAMKFQAGPGAKEIDRYVPSVSSDLSMPPPGAVRPRRN